MEAGTVMRWEGTLSKHILGDQLVFLLNLAKLSNKNSKLCILFYSKKEIVDIYGEVHR